MSKKLYVGSLPYEMGDDDLRSIFSSVGNVESAKVITDHTGRSKGFGFVEMSSPDEAKKAISQLNGTEQGNRNRRSILVSEARPETKRTGGGGGRDGGGRDGGGFGGRKKFSGGGGGYGGGNNHGGGGYRDRDGGGGRDGGGHRGGSRHRDD